MEYKIFTTDLDGTLLDNNQKVSHENYEALKSLKQKNIVSIIATGRNLASFKRVISNDFPIDYLVFSSGAGIMDWKNKKILHAAILDFEIVKEIYTVLRSFELDFMIHKPIPDNHIFGYYSTDTKNPDFHRRIKLYEDTAFRLNSHIDNFGEASQLLAVIPNNLELFNLVKSQVTNAKVIRSTSPIDGNSIWIEFFPKEVSKANGIKIVCDLLKINPKATICIGNDYNDLDMLKNNGKSYVVKNSPDELLQEFIVTKSNTENAVAHIIKKYF